MSRLLLAALLAGAACTSDVNTDGGGETGEDEPEETRPEPVFLSGTDLELRTTRTRPFDVQVKFIYASLTQLLIDGVSAGVLGDLGDVGEYVPSDDEPGAGTLSLGFHGGMAPATHTIQLFTPGTAQALLSKEREIAFVSQAPPPLELTFDDAVVATGTVLGQSGDLLLLASPGDGEAEVTIARVGDGAWSSADTRTLSLPGLSVVPGQRTPAVAAGLSADATKIRIAWRVGWPGERIDVVELTWGGDQDGTVSEPVRALELTPALTGTVEWAALDRPLLRGDLLVAELDAFHDVESALPGDHGIVTVKLTGSPPSPGLQKRAFLTTELVDVSGLGPTLDLHAVEGGSANAFSVRLEGRRPGIVDVAPSPSLRPATITGTYPELPGDSPIATIVGSLGSRLAVAVVAEHPRLVFIDASGHGGAVDVSPATADLPERAPTGEPAVALVSGSIVAIVPYGDGDPVYLLATGGDDVVVTAVDGVACDAVAVPPTLSGNAEEDPSVHVACLRAGELITGTLRSTIRG